MRYFKTMWLIMNLLYLEPPTVMPQASEHPEVFNQNTGSYPYGYWALADGPGLTRKGIGIPHVHGLRGSVCPGRRP